MNLLNRLEVGFVVEGHGDQKAVPAVFRRIAEREFPGLQVVDRAVMRVSRYKLKQRGELERTVEYLARGLSGRRAILITIDTEGEDAPGCLGPDLLRRAREQRSDVAIGVALAHREFENWLVAAAASLSGRRDLPADLRSPGNPEELSGKKWLSERMIGRPYRETTDQEELARRFDIEVARQGSRSFGKFYREVERLCGTAMER